MLARWLRILLLLQALIGAVLGYALCPQWLAALGGAFALALLTSAGVCLLSGWEARNGEGAALWWRAFLGEWIAALRIYGLRQPWASLAPTVQPPTSTPTRVPVVLVHGYLCNHRLWDDMVRALRANGHSVLAINLEPVFASIDDYAASVQAAVVALRQHTDAAQVALVGHSMGGLAIRAWIHAYGTSQACRVLTLGTPHQGTRIRPGTGSTPNGRQMQWHSPWLHDLAASESPDTRSLMHLALTAQDNIVFPQRAQVLPGLTPKVFTGMGHLQMCLDPGVIGWVCAELAELPLVQATQ